MTESLSLAAHAFANRVSMSVSVDETLLHKQVNLLTSFRELSFSVETSPVWLKHIYSVLSALTWRTLHAAVRSRLCRSIVWNELQHAMSCIVWNELQHAMSSMSMQTKRNICALIKQVTLWRKISYIVIYQGDKNGWKWSL